VNISKEIIKQRLLDKRKITKSGCWEWQGTRSVYNYGIIKLGKKLGFKIRNYPVHRISMYIFKDFDVSSKLCCLHKCDNPPCFNPEHIFIGTKADNNADRDKKGRKITLRGEECPWAKITEKQAKQIIKLKKEGLTCIRLAKQFGIGPMQISRISTGKRWPHLQ
jgi:hypothetical protein